MLNADKRGVVVVHQMTLEGQDAYRVLLSGQQPFKNTVSASQLANKDGSLTMEPSSLNN